MTVLARPEVILGGDSGPLDRAIRNASTRLEQAGAKFQRIGTQLSAAITLPLVGVSVAAARATANWETAMVGVRKTVDATDAQIAELGDSFVRMSERIPVASDELANIAAEAGQLGIATENLRAFVETVSALRVATNLGEQAGTSLARLANIMGTAQTDFDRLGSTIVDLGNNLATTEAEIVGMALRIAGAGSQIGLTEAQVLSFAGALSSVGINAEAGGTAISRVMIEIASAVEQGGEALGKFAAVADMTSAEFSERFETDASGAIAAFISGLGELESQGKSTFATLDDLGLGEIRVRDTLLRASNASDIFTEALDRGTRAWDENTALTREAGLFFNRLAARFTTLRNKAANITAELGDALRPAIDRVIQVGDRLLNIARGLIERFAELDPQVRMQVALWAAVAAAIGPVSVAIGTVLTVFGSVLGVIASVGSALAGLALVIVALKNDWLGMGEAASRTWDTVLNTATTALTALLDFAKPIFNFIIGFFAGTVNAAVESWGIIRYEFGRAFDWIRDKAAAIMEKIAAGMALVGRAGKMLAFEIRNALSGGNVDWEEEGSAIGERIARGFAEAFATDYVGAFIDIVRTGIDRAREFIARAIEMLRSMAGGAAEAVAALETAGEALDGVAEGLDDAGETGTAAIRELGNAGESLVSNLSSGFGDLVTGAQDLGDAIHRMAENIIRDLVRIIAQAALTRAILGAVPGGGSILALTSIPARAHGGPVVAGHPYLIGERGPEVFVPSSSGMVVAGAPAAAGGGQGAAAFLDSLLARLPVPRELTPEAAAAVRSERARFAAAVEWAKQDGVRFDR